MPSLGTLARLAIGLGCFAAAAAGVWVGAGRVYSAYGVEKQGSALSATLAIERLAKRKPMSPRDPDAYYTVLLGDSMMKRWQRGKVNHTVPHKVSAGLGRLRGEGRAIHLVPFTLAGLGVDEEYVLADEILDLQPDLVVLQFNLKRLSAIVRAEWRREKLVGFVRPHRIPQALGLDLFGRDLTLDEFLFRIALVQAGGAHVWHEVSLLQGRTEVAYRDLARKIESKYGGRSVARYRTLRGLRSAEERTSKRGRPSVSTVRKTYGTALSGVGREHPVLRVLAAAVETFRAAGSEVLVFVSPANVEHFESLGLLDREGLDRTLDSIRATVESAGGRFADFHGIVRDEGFRDSAGHLSIRGNPDPHTRLGNRLAREIMLTLGEPVRER